MGRKMETGIVMVQEAFIYQNNQDIYAALKRCVCATPAAVQE